MSEGDNIVALSPHAAYEREREKREPVEAVVSALEDAVDGARAGDLRAVFVIAAYQGARREDKAVHWWSELGEASNGDVQCMAYRLGVLQAAIFAEQIEQDAEACTDDSPDDPHAS